MTRRKEGVNVLYALADDRTFALCELMCTRVRELAATAAALVARPSTKRRSG